MKFIVISMTCLQDLLDLKKILTDPQYNSNNTIWEANEMIIEKSKLYNVVVLDENNRNLRLANSTDKDLTNPNFRFIESISMEAEVRKFLSKN